MMFTCCRVSREGTGKKLVMECLSKLKAKGAEAVRLAVLSENKTAISLYEKLGFKIYRHSMIRNLKH
jgi:ribosomal protein S18 acetylase RimI-like enzyme